MQKPQEPLIYEINCAPLSMKRSHVVLLKQVEGQFNTLLPMRELLYVKESLALFTLVLFVLDWSYKPIPFLRTNFMPQGKC